MSSQNCCYPCLIAVSKLPLEGKRCAQMPEHRVAFGRLVFLKELIDDDCRICLFAQPGGRFL
jgi:hypothetical protein